MSVELENIDNQASSGTAFTQGLEETQVSTEAQNTQPDAATAGDAGVASPTAPIEESPDTSRSLEAMRTSARNLGIEVGDDVTEADLALAAMRRINELRPTLDFASRVAPYADKFSEYLASQQQAQAQQPAETKEEEWSVDAHFKKAWGGPEWLPEFDQLMASNTVEYDEETRMYKAVPGYEMTLGPTLQKLNEANQYRSKFWKDLTNGNPYQTMYNSMVEPMRRAWQQDLEEYIERRERAAQERNAIQTFEHENSSWMHTIDPVTGQRMFTDKGADFMDTIQSMMKQGLTDPMQILEWAKKIHGISQQSNAGESLKPPSVRQPAPPQQTFRENTLKRAQKSSGNVNVGESLEGESSLDINSLYKQAFQKTMR